MIKICLFLSRNTIFATLTYITYNNYIQKHPHYSYTLTMPVASSSHQSPSDADIIAQDKQSKQAHVKPGKAVDHASKLKEQEKKAKEKQEIEKARQGVIAKWTAGRNPHDSAYLVDFLQKAEMRVWDDLDPHTNTYLDQDLGTKLFLLFHPTDKNLLAYLDKNGETLLDMTHILDKGTMTRFHIIGMHKMANE
jgi:hypothetical protein